MRFGDRVGLTRDDFDFKNNLLHIKRTWDYKEGFGFSTTKKQFFGVRNLNRPRYHECLSGFI